MQTAISDRNFLAKYYQLFFVLLVLGLYALILATPIRLTSQDLGRHLMNGREIVNQNWSVLYRNHYSYTQPETRFINHHWLFGLCSYLIYTTIGFGGLHLVNIAILLLALLLLIRLMSHKSSIFTSLLLALPATLFFATRTEIRPESLGLLLLIHCLWQINLIRQKGSITYAQIIVLTVQQLIWVNWHISFVFGLASFLWLLIATIIFKQPKLSHRSKQKLLWLSVALIGVSLLNPNHIWGLLQPLTIFADYGYSIVENQNLLFLWRVIDKSIIWPFLFLASVSIFLMSLLKHKLVIFDKILLLLGIVLGFFALRNIPIFVALTFPILAKLIQSGWQQLSTKIKLDYPLTSKTIFLSICYMLTIIFVMSSKRMLTNQLKVGLADGQLAAADYIKHHNLAQPIFNNYDLGSYLIFTLYPEYRVFTDNRPEAYGSDFFQKEYIPMQQNPKVWREQLQKYRFRTVVFGNNDITPWGQQFRAFIRNQNQWQLIFQNQYVDIYQLTNNPNQQAS